MDEAERKRNYETQHRLCPQCGSDNITSTCIGWDLGQRYPDRRRNPNKSTCEDCKWRGTAKELKDRP